MVFSGSGFVRVGKLAVMDQSNSREQRESKQRSQHLVASNLDRSQGRLSKNNGAHGS